MSNLDLSVELNEPEQLIREIGVIAHERAPRSKIWATIEEYAHVLLQELEAKNAPAQKTPAAADRG